MSDKITAQDVLYEYKSAIDSFDNTQKNQWLRWSGILPQRIANISNMYNEVETKASLWEKTKTIFILLAAVIPVIVTILVEVANIPTFASIVDLAFPVGAGIVDRKHSKANKKIVALISVSSPYTTLLADIVSDIVAGIYPNRMNTHQKLWNTLDMILIHAGIKA